MANKKKTKRARKKADKKIYSAFLLFISVTLVFVFMSFKNNFASNNQNSLWAQLMEAFLRGDDAKKESLLQRIKESEAEAALKGSAASNGVRQGTTAVPPAGQATTAANWRDYDWSRFGITNPAYSGKKNAGNDAYYNQREAEAETLPTVVYEDWDPYNYQGFYEETKKSKVLTPRFETNYNFDAARESTTAYVQDDIDWSTFDWSALFQESKQSKVLTPTFETDDSFNALEEYLRENQSGEFDWSNFDWSTIYKETKKSDVIMPTHETTTVRARTWQDWFRPAETTQEVYNIPKETSKSGILFSIFGTGGNKKEDTTETLQAETIPSNEGELVVSGSLIKESKEKSRVIDNKIYETTRIITTATTAATSSGSEDRYVLETTRSSVLIPKFETAARESLLGLVSNEEDYEEVVSGPLIRESTARSRVLEKVATETTRPSRNIQETTPAHAETTIARETRQSLVLTPEFSNGASETTSRNSRGYEEVISGSLIRETSARSRVLDKTVTQAASRESEYYVMDEETVSEDYTYAARETEKSNILFSLFGIGARKETMGRAEQTTAATTAQNYYETTKPRDKAGILFPIFNNKRNDEVEITETAGSNNEYEEYEGEQIVAGSIFDETKRRARIIDKSADRALSQAQYETSALYKETTFDARPFEVRWPISLVGAGGWYFLKNSSILDSETANGKIPERYVKPIVEKLEKCRKLLGKSKKDFAIILCPDKSAIYKEFYPAGTPYPNESSKIKSFIDYAKAHSELSVIYPERAISFVKNVCDVYYKQDSHWNRIAGYIATRELFEMMGINYTLDSIMSHEITVSKKLYPGDLYDDGTDVEYDLKGITDDSYVSKADYSGVDFTNDKAPMNIRSHSPVDNRSALVIRDSFIASMLPALGPQFKNTSLYHIENFMSIDKQALQKDVIIIELTARNFVSLYNLADYLISILEG